MRATAFMLLAGLASAQGAELTGDIVGIHDPVISRENDTYYVYSTNTDAPPAALRIRSSQDLKHWTARGHVFDKLPDWATQAIPGSAWRLGAGYHARERAVSPVLLCVHVRFESLGHRAGHE
jgi:beta-xylosidase